MQILSYIVITSLILYAAVFVIEWICNYQPSKIMQKSQMEILDETVEAYKEGLSARAYEQKTDSAVGACKYLTTDGKMCAVGRCCIDPKSDWIGGVMLGIENGEGKRLGLEEVLKPEHRGHSIQFWYDLQCLHDSVANFTDAGYSQRGLNEIEEFKRRIVGKHYET